MRSPQPDSEILPPLPCGALTKFTALLLLLLTIGLCHGQTPVPLNVGNTEKQMIRYGLDFERLWF